MKIIEELLEKAFFITIFSREWESGIDQGVRFDVGGMGRMACVDATSHVYFLYKVASIWADMLDLPNDRSNKREAEIKKFICDSLYVKEEGFFYDRWAVLNDSLRNLTFESMWPLVVGAITEEMANRYIDNYLLDTSCFFTPHPISTVGRRDPKFSIRMWRGPVWNSMSYWAARGCFNYGRKDAANIILEKALDSSSKQFIRTGTIWEFYHPLGGNPEDAQKTKEATKPSL